MATIQYLGRDVSYSGSETPDPSFKAMEMTDQEYADAAAMITGEALQVGDIFYPVNAGDTQDGALVTARTAALTPRENTLLFPYDAYRVTSSSVIEYYLADWYETEILVSVTKIDAEVEAEATKIDTVTPLVISSLTDSGLAIESVNARVVTLGTQINRLEKAIKVLRDYRI